MWKSRAASLRAGCVLACLVPTSLLAELAVTPAEGIAFGNTAIGTENEKSFLVTNDGTATVTGEATITVGDSVFKLVDVDTGVALDQIPYTLDPSASKAIVVQFTPGAQGDFSATVDFSGGSGVTRPVTGTGSTVPDFGDVDDPLQEQWKILRVDGLVATAPLAPAGGANLNAVRMARFEYDRQIVVDQERQDLQANCLETAFKQTAPRLQAVPLRMFDLPSDVLALIQAVDADCEILSFEVRDPLAPVNNTKTDLDASPIGMQVAVGDFNTDGYDDLFIINGNKALIASAADQTLHDATEGVAFSDSADTSDFGIPWNSPTVGDFDNDGNLDVAWPAGAPEDGAAVFVNFATVCSGDVDGLNCAGKQAFDIVLNTLPAIELESEFIDNSIYFPPAVAVTAGAYDPTRKNEGSAQLVVVDSTQEKFIISYHAFDGNEPQTVERTGRPLSVLATDGRLNWFGGTDQPVLGLQGLDLLNGQFVDHFFDLIPISIGANGSMNLFPLTLKGGFFSNLNMDTSSLQMTGLAVGRFTQQTQTENKDNFNPQIAAWFGSRFISPSTALLGVFNTANPPSDYTPVFRSPHQFSGMGSGDGLPRYGNRLYAGDLNGLTFRVGPPSIFRVAGSVQPIMYLAKPPMFADYIDPGLSRNQPDLMNFTATWNDFFTKFSFTETTSEFLSEKDTTSWTWGAGETFSIGGKIAFGNSAAGGGADAEPPEDFEFLPGEGEGFIVEFNQAWEISETETIEDVYNTYTEESRTFTAQTGFDDIVRYSQRRMNYYLYEVIGQRVCPATDPDCETEDEGPLFVIVSGADELATTRTSTCGQLEWCQVLHEPFQPLSYPWDEDQLNLRYPGLSVLGSSDTVDTINAPISYAFNWRNTTQNSQTAGASQQQDFSASLSIGIGNPDFKKSKSSTFYVEASGSYNASCALSTVNAKTATVSASTGLTAGFPGAFRAPELYSYPIQAVFFGQTPLSDPVDLDLPGPGFGTVGPFGVGCWGQTPQSLDVEAEQQTQGTLQGAWVADPTDGADWWNSSPYKDDIDIAVVRPNHLQAVTKSLSAGNDVPSNCLSVNPKDTNKLNCIKIYGPRSTSELWTAKFYDMKGMLVTANAGTGPQRQIVTEGDQLVIQPTLFNYSLKTTPDNSVIKLRIYRQTWNAGTNKPQGLSELIEEIVYREPIPGFNAPGTPETPNYATFGSIWDTTGFASPPNTFYTFWVIAWAEDAQGNLIDEVPNHGLTEIPSDSLNFLNCHYHFGLFGCTDPPIETLVVDECLAAESVTSCGKKTVKTSMTNNVGHLKLPLIVLPADQPVADDPVEIGRVVVDNVRVSPPFAQAGELVEVRADIRLEGGNQTRDAMVWLYDEIPGPDAIAFDAESTVQVPPNGMRHVHVAYVPDTCGPLGITVLASVHGQADAVGSAPLNVACEPTVFSGRGRVIGDGPRGSATGSLNLVFEFEAEDEIKLSDAAVTVRRILGEPSEGELVRDRTRTRLTPVALAPTGNSRSRYASFETAQKGTRVNLTLAKTGMKRVKAELSVDRAAIRAPRCITDDTGTYTELETLFEIADLGHDPVSFSVVQRWECEETGDGFRLGLVNDPDETVASSAAGL